MKKIVVLFVLSVLVLAGGSMANKMALGLQGLTITSNAATMATFQYEFNPNFTGEAGLSFVSAAGNSSFALDLNGKFPLKKEEKLSTYWGVGLAYVSNPGLAANSSIFGLALSVGMEYLILPSISLEASLVPLSYWSFTAAGATNTTLAVLNSTTAAGALTPPCVVIGAHYYLN